MMHTVAIMATCDRIIPLVSLKSWWNDRKDSRRLPLLDVRSEQDYKERRLLDSAEATIVHIPFEQLQSRSYELPPRHLDFALLVPNSDSIPFLEEQLLGRASRNRQTRRRQQPWNIRYAILGCREESWEQASEYGILQNHTLNDSSTSFQPLPRLWQPDPMVEQVLLPLLTAELRKLGSKKMVTFEIWDLGAGAGRDVCYLAEQLKATLSSPNFTVVGLDQRYLNVEHEESRQFYNRHRVSDVTRCQKINLNNWSEFENTLRNVQTQKDLSAVCFFAVRFWNRELVEQLASCDMLSAGTIFAISQFGKDAVGALWNFDHPKEKHVLERNELREIFEQCITYSWRILHDKIARDSDHGRTLIQFAAQRV